MCLYWCHCVTHHNTAVRRQPPTAKSGISKQYCQLYIFISLKYKMRNIIRAGRLPSSLLPRPSERRCGTCTATCTRCGAHRMAPSCLHAITPPVALALALALALRLALAIAAARRSRTPPPRDPGNCARVRCACVSGACHRMSLRDGLAHVVSL